MGASAPPRLHVGAYAPLPLLELQLSKIERRSEWDEGTETWRIARIQYAGNAMRHKRRDPPRSPESAAAGANSPTSRRGKTGTDASDAPPVPDIAAELSSVYFSYSPDPAAMAEEEAALYAEQQAEQEMERARLQEARDRRRYQEEQAELNAALGY